MNRRNAKRLAVCVAIFSTYALAAGNRKEFKYTVKGENASINVVNQFGSVVLTPASGNQVIVSATTHSDNVEADSSQSGDRIEVRTHFLKDGNDSDGKVDYEIQVPNGATVSAQVASGSIRAEHLNGDVTLSGDSASIEARNINNAHVHARTVSGPITLADISGGHVEIGTGSGKVALNNVNGPSVTVNTTSSPITYDGNFGAGGAYRLSSHSGPIDVSLPASASVEVRAESVNGSVQNDFPLQQRSHSDFTPKVGRSFQGFANSGSSSVQLHSFSGTIRVKKR
ncbi:MAG: DUF4097 family beta strand repeat-containing protein [Terriglobales bacterium]|jgi:DUF4097 and DUF4098 domain-containing protein YvlB